jgi:NADPH2:quinone reductase
MVAVPDGVDIDVATALLHAGATALGLAASIGIAADERVLVMGAAGGLGALLVQLALASGARIIGAARGEAKLAMIRDLGAEAVDYSEPGWGKRVAELTGDTGPDVVFDGVGGDLGREAFQVIAAGGRFSAHGAPERGLRGNRSTGRGPPSSDRQGNRAGSVPARRTRRGGSSRLGRASRWPDPAVIGHRFPLEQAAAAHAAMEARSVVGKTLLMVRDR